MWVEPFGKEREPKIIFEINNRYHLHFNDESTMKISEDEQEYYLGLYDITNIEHDFFVLIDDQGVIQGVSGLLRSSYFSQVWFVMIAILPESINEPKITELLNAVLDLTKEYLKRESREKDQPIQLVMPSANTYLQQILTDRGMAPIEYSVNMQLNKTEYQFQGDLPPSMTIRAQSTPEEVQGYIQVFNEAFASHFNYEPLIIDDPAVQHGNYKVEQGEVERIFAYINDIMVGVIILSTPKQSSIGMIPVVAVKPEYQGRGIGTALIHHGIKRLQEHEYASIILHGVFYSNENALKLYLRLGWTIIEKSKYVFYSLHEKLLPNKTT